MAALLAIDEAALEAAREGAASAIGPLEAASPVWPFEWTSYYAEEMGPALVRQIVAARRLADPGELAAWKLRTNEAEREVALARGGGRPVNIDPGYIAPAKLVLATTKDFAHRVYLGRGIYAEVTLRFAGGRFEALPWTYPDFRSGRYDAFLAGARARCLPPGSPSPVRS